MTLNAKITAHNGILICQTMADKSSEECVLISDTPGVIGNVYMNTKETLGISKEALEILRTLKKGRDSIGDIDWFATGDKYAFGWLGPIHRLVDPATAETSRQYVIGDYVDIPNSDAPQEAIDAIEQM